MGFQAKNIQGSKNTNPSIEVTKQELEFLLSTIQNGMFKGKDLELLYNLTLKLQKEYITLTK
jgi:hypothetical protein